MLIVKLFLAHNSLILKTIQIEVNNKSTMTKEFEDFHEFKKITIRLIPDQVRIPLLNCVFEEYNS